MTRTASIPKAPGVSIHYRFEEGGGPGCQLPLVPELHPIRCPSPDPQNACCSSNASVQIAMRWAVSEGTSDTQNLLKLLTTNSLLLMSCDVALPLLRGGRIVLSRRTQLRDHNHDCFAVSARLVERANRQPVKNSQIYDTKR